MADIKKLFATASLKIELKGVGEIELILSPADPIELSKVGLKLLKEEGEALANFEMIENFCVQHIVDWKGVEYEGKPIAPSEKIGDMEAVRRVLRAVCSDGRLLLNHVTEALVGRDFFLQNSGEPLAS